MDPNSKFLLCRELPMNIYSIPGLMENNLNYRVTMLAHYQISYYCLVKCIGWNRRHLGTAANVSCDYSGLLPKACHYVLNLCWSSSRWSCQCVHLSCPARFPLYDGVQIQYPNMLNTLVSYSSCFILTLLMNQSIKE